MSKTNFIPRIINFEPLDYQIVRRFADEMRMGKKGFSAALRTIIREWHSLRMIHLSPNRDLANTSRELDSSDNWVSQQPAQSPRGAHRSLNCKYRKEN